MPQLFDTLTFRHIYFAGKTFTPNVVQLAVDELAAYLEANRRSESPFVFLFAANHIKTIIAYFAILKAGLIVVPIDPTVRPRELEDLERDSCPTASIRINLATVAFDYRREISFAERVNVSLPDDDLSDVCMMCYTAAEDGYYKGALLTKTNLLTMAKAIADGHSLTPTSTSCAFLPVYHIFGLQTGVLAPLVSGGSFLLEPLTDLGNLATAVGSFKELGVTDFYSVPVVYYLLLRVPHARHLLADVRTLTSGGCNLPLRTFEQFRRRVGMEIRQGYGLTEASLTCTHHLPFHDVKPDSVGPTFSCCELNIVDEHHRTVERGVSGEICVKGANVMKGYFGHASATRSAIRNGWLHTGDLGMMDTDGYVYVTGIKKRMLNVGGNNVYPAEVERHLRQHPNVEYAEVFGAGTASGGHKVCARVTLRTANAETKKELSNWCHASLSWFKIPKQLKFI